jgi:hypothetical protein
LSDVGGDSSQQSERYERLRAWYLAHLRKSQLTSDIADIANGMTPATLIKRDREALELLIAEENSPPATESRREPFKFNPAK